MIKITYEMKVYRKFLSNMLKPDDIVCELGCHIGKSSKFILDRIPEGKLIALDNSPEANEKMEDLMEEYSNLTFINCDVRLHESLKKVKEKIDSCNLLSVDLGGGYHPDTTFKVYYIWSSTFKPTNTIIRNRGLIDFLNSATCEENIYSKNGYLSSCGDMGIPPQIKEFELWSNKL
jgi:hypothetical protein